MDTETTPDKGIAHLDFPIEEEKEESPKKHHYTHPIDPDVFWCGKPKTYKSSGRPGLGTNVPASDITCVDCLHLFIEKGGNWWWRVNRAWYEDND